MDVFVTTTTRLLWFTRTALSSRSLTLLRNTNPDTAVTCFDDALRERNVLQICRSHLASSTGRYRVPGGRDLCRPGGEQLRSDQLQGCLDLQHDEV